MYFPLAPQILQRSSSRTLCPDGPAMTPLRLALPEDNQTLKGRREEIKDNKDFNDIKDAPKKTWSLLMAISANPSSSGSGMRSITLLASEVIGFARVAFLALKNTLAFLRRSRQLGTGNWPLGTGHCPQGHKKAATSREVTASGFTFGAASLRGDATTPRAVQEDGDTSLNSSLAYSATAASQVKEVG